MGKIYVKLVQENLIEIFDTKKDRKKKIIFTPVKDNQKEAQIKFFYEKKHLKTITITDLPPAGHHILNLPFVFELTGNSMFTITYYDFNRKITETIDLDRARKQQKRLIIALIIAGTIGLTGLLSYLIYTNRDTLFTSRPVTTTNTTIDKENTKTDTKNLPAEPTETPTPKPTIKETPTPTGKITPIPTPTPELQSYTLQSLNDIIKENLPVYFYKNRDVMLPDETARLNKLIAYMAHYQSARLVITGHSQSVNLPENEMKLSIKRAEQVANYLRKAVKNRNIVIEIKGLGSSSQAILDATGDNKQLNRRVEIEVTSAKAKGKR